eukprot:TRINITY_DN30098_c0_g1_i1.p1 TRINITY_DN30098_c0_g1~~TRINITY_DN30098_c0_g1_i1.p1  ORF type:complete len:583 (-),score=79.71 TRINITY_DN30098_c0_g1_i1:439-2139(-)
MASDNGGLLHEYMKWWAFHTAMIIAGCTKLLVNQIEPFFARSLVVCEQAAVAGNYTGSAFCGDRAVVLNGGMHISTRGQAQENLAMMVSLCIVGLLSDMYGRRPAILVGVSATMISVVLFLVSTRARAWGPVLFTLGQGLQGFFPNEFLSNVCVADIAQMPSTDAVKAGQLQAMIPAVLGPLLFIASGVIQVIELTDYTAVWCLMLVLNLSASFVAFAYLSETRPVAESDEDAKKKTIKGSLCDYRCVLTKPAVWRMLLGHFLTAFEAVSVFLISLQVMAFHGWSQKSFLLSIIGVLVISITSQAKAGDMIDKWGLIRSYQGLYIANFAVGVVERLVIVVDPWLWILVAYLRATFNAKDAFTVLTEVQLYHPDDNAKIIHLKWLVGYLANALAFPFYASLFDAQAVTYYDQVFPNLAVIAVDTLKVCMLFGMLWSFSNGTEGFGPVMARLDELSTEIADLLQEISCSLGNQEVAARIKEAGFPEIFKEWLGEGDTKLEMSSVDHLIGLLRPMYRGKHVREVVKVRDATIRLRDAAAALPVLSASAAEQLGNNATVLNKSDAEKKAD